MSIPFNPPKFTITGPVFARLVSLHDGDTFTAVFNLANAYWKFQVRVDGIDTPELVNKNPKAIEARHRLFQLLTNDTTTDTRTFKKADFDSYFETKYIEFGFACAGFDKYGRVLGDLPTVKDTLIREGLANPYSGGTKEKFQ